MDVTGRISRSGGTPLVVADRHRALGVVHLSLMPALPLLRPREVVRAFEHLCCSGCSWLLCRMDHLSGMDRTEPLESSEIPNVDGRQL